MTPTHVPRWRSAKNAAVLAYERTRTAKAASRRTFWLNALRRAGLRLAPVPRVGHLEGDALTARHTPGPWQVLNDYDGRFTIIGNVDGEYFTDSPQPHMTYDFVCGLEDEYGETSPNAAANLALLLAAPELLEALKALTSQWERSGFVSEKNFDEFLNARAAIARAEGREP